MPGRQFQPWPAQPGIAHQQPYQPPQHAHYQLQLQGAQPGYMQPQQGYQPGHQPGYMQPQLGYMSGYMPPPTGKREFTDKFGFIYSTDNKSGESDLKNATFVRAATGPVHSPFFSKDDTKCDFEVMRASLITNITLAAKKRTHDPHNPSSESKVPPDLYHSTVLNNKKEWATFCRGEFGAAVPSNSRSCTIWHFLHADEIHSLKLLACALENMATILTLITRHEMYTTHLFVDLVKSLRGGSLSAHTRDFELVAETISLQITSVMTDTISESCQAWDGSQVIVLGPTSNPATGTYGLIDALNAATSGIVIDANSKMNHENSATFLMNWKKKKRSHSSSDESSSYDSDSEEESTKTKAKPKVAKDAKDKPKAKAKAKAKTKPAATISVGSKAPCLVHSLKLFRLGNDCSMGANCGFHHPASQKEVITLAAELAKVRVKSDVHMENKVKLFALKVTKVVLSAEQKKPLE